VRELSILIVEDDPLTRKALRVMLEHEDYPVDEAIDGVMAVEMIADGYYDVVITDMNMPGTINGLGVLERCLELRPHTAVIVATGFATVEDSVEAMKKGAVDYLVKPVKRAELALRLDNIAASKRLVKEALDLREAITVTEENAERTIREQEFLIADLRLRFEQLRKVIADKALAPGERIIRALELLRED
jgi:DNA-binding NtrC family response regulator